VKSVLIVAAHPDDAEIAMGMRIRAHVLAGDYVRIHCITPGAPTPGGASIRQDEAKAAGATLGVAEYTFSAVPDNHFTERRVEINTLLFEVFGRRRPDVVYTHYPEDQHLDHSITSQEATTVALREANDLHYFRSPYSRNFEPNRIFAGTPELLAAKAAALDCFTSQEQLDMDVFRTLNIVAHRQYVHHRVVERFPPELRHAELFHSARVIDFAASPAQDACAPSS